MSTENESLIEFRKRWYAQLQEMSMKDLFDAMADYRDTPESLSDIHERLKEVANDLLAACEAALPYLQQMSNEEDAANFPYLTGTIELLEATIAKAEGRS
jgi:uncharacterized protein YicC (UPF0701 family)